MAHIDFWAENRTCFKMLIINVEKKSTKILAYHKPQVATFLCIDVENDGYCCFAKMLNFGSKTFKMLEFTFGIDLLLSHSQHFCFWQNACRNLTRKKKQLINYLCHPKILAQNSRFTKKCWLFVESLSWPSGENFSSALGRVNSSIHNILVILISSECWVITQIY